MSETDGLPLFTQTIPQAAAMLSNVRDAVAPPKPLKLSDPKVRGTVETPRLTNQCQKILERLQRGPATNKELADLSLKYTGRISDLRASGYAVEVLSRDRKTGVTIYHLKEHP